MLLSRIERFNKRLRRLRQGADPVAVHEFRIVCRELLACRPLLQTVSSTRYWKKRVAKSIKVLNQLRDLQQMQERTAREPCLQKSMKRSVARAQRRWEHYQPQMHASAFMRSLDATVNAVKKAGDEQDAYLLAVWCEQWQRTLRQVQKRRAAVDVTDLRTLHRLRIRYKRLRYLLEVLVEAGVLPDVDRKSLKYWQVIFGDIEDYRVMARLVAKMDGPAALGEAFAERARKNASQYLREQEAFANFIAMLDQHVALHLG